MIHLYKNLSRLSFTTFFLIFYLSYFGGSIYIIENRYTMDKRCKLSFIANQLSIFSKRRNPWARRTRTAPSWKSAASDTSLLPECSL